MRAITSLKTEIYLKIIDILADYNVMAAATAMMYFFYLLFRPVFNFLFVKIII